MAIEGISGRRLLCCGLWAVVSIQDGCNGFDNSWTLIMFSSAYSHVHRGHGKDVKQRRSGQAQVAFLHRQKIATM